MKMESKTIYIWQSGELGMSQKIMGVFESLDIAKNAMATCYDRMTYDENGMTGWSNGRWTKIFMAELSDEMWSNLIDEYAKNKQRDQVTIS